ncbi:MAG: TonB-dependent receptor [Acidobacteria bacterium]|nr:TonB-dependent receptor [Acidobacteriota bacterium]
MRTALFILPFLIGTMSPAVMAATLEGNVKDINDRPLSGVRITVNGGEQIVETDAAGEFTISVADDRDSVRLRFERAQFNPETRTIRFAEGITRLEVYLVPLNYLKDEITITALNEEEKSVDVPFAQTVVGSTTLKEEQPENIVSSLQATPGVHFVGKGGFTATPSIRGLARRRILLMANGARITSDRSAGTSAGFIAPEFIRQIEVLRSSASVLYGSDALGGVINVITEDRLDPAPRFGILNLSGNTNDWRRNAGFRFNQDLGRGFDLYTNLQFTKADDYSSADERIYNSGYTYFSGIVSLNYRSAERDFSLNYLKAYGHNIYRPRRDNDPDRQSLYPVEDNNLIQFSYCEKEAIEGCTLTLSTFINPNRIDLHKFRFSRGQFEYSRNDALDIGFKGVMKKNINAGLSFQIGMDYYGRSGVDMENGTAVNGLLEETCFPLADGNRHDYGIYVTVDYSGFDALDLLGGVRYGFFRRNALADGVRRENNSSAPAAFFGVTRQLSDSMNIFFNAATAFRMPSLSEAFYSGITGRGDVVGNPALGPERSYNFDTGFKYYTNNVFAGFYVFYYRINDLVEKFDLGNELYTYENLDRGSIKGFELEFQYYPIQSLQFFGNYFHYWGKSSVTDQRLNDIPSPKLFLGGRYWWGRFWVEANHLYSVELEDPGPAETMVEDYNLTNLKAGFYVNNETQLFFKVSNLFDASYYANADPDIPPAPGFSLSIGLRHQF